MKKFNLSLIAVLAMGTFAMAGGDIEPVEPMLDAPMAEEEEEEDTNGGSFYIGAGYSALSLTETPTIGAGDRETTGNGATFLIGYTFNDYIGIEGRYTTTFGDLTVEKTTFMGLAPDVTSEHDIDASIENIAIYLKPRVAVTDALNLYALVGYGQTKFDANDMSESGFQYGVGANYTFAQNIAVFTDYTRLFDDGFSGFDVTVDSFNVGLTYTF